MYGEDVLCMWSRPGADYNPVKIVDLRDPEKVSWIALWTNSEGGREIKSAS